MKNDDQERKKQETLLKKVKKTMKHDEKEKKPMKNDEKERAKNNET